MTLIGKLEQAYEIELNKRLYASSFIHVKETFDKVINIIKQHSEWIPVSELKLTEDDYGKDFIAYECEYFKTTGRATYQDGGYWRFDCARGYCASANISHVIPIPKFQPPSDVEITKDAIIEKTLLERGNFKKKLQSDGDYRLNDYVIPDIKACIEAVNAHEQAKLSEVQDD